MLGSQLEQAGEPGMTPPHCAYGIQELLTMATELGPQLGIFPAAPGTFQAVPTGSLGSPDLESL